jgi:DNA replication protein DnaC
MDATAKPEAVTLSCETHGEYKAQRVELLGKVMKQPCPICQKERKTEESEREEAQRKADRARYIRGLFGNSGIPPRFQGRTFGNYRTATEKQSSALKIAKRYADKFDDRLAHGGGLVMAGKPGTGKTHLASAIANHVIASGRSAVFLSVIKAVRSVKDTWRKDSDGNEQKAINRLIAPDLLILDEVGVQWGSEAEKLIMFEVINGRYENMKPTILISNLPETELSGYMGERLLDRMSEGGGAVISFDWESYRAKVHQDGDLPAQLVADIDDEFIERDKRRSGFIG